MIFDFGYDLFPIASAVVGRKNRPACADDNRVFFVADKDARQRYVKRHQLSSPIKTAVFRPQNRAVRADGKAGFLVLVKMNRVERIALRQRILPRPTERVSFLRKNKNRAAQNK